MFKSIFLKKKLHKRLTIAISIPYTKAQFERAFDMGYSDFISSLVKAFKITDKGLLWDKYAPLANRINKALKSYMTFGANVIDELTINKLDQIADSDVVIFIMHHSDTSDELEMSNGMINTDRFIKAIPQTYSGVIDLSSCFSSHIQIAVKMRCPNSRVLAIRTKTSIDIRLLIYRHIINLMRHNDSLTYLDALKQSVNLLDNVRENGKPINREDIIYLGGQILSSVFAPKEVVRGESFMIQIAIHKSADTEEVELIAREVDEDTSLRNPCRLKMKLRKEDRIDFSLKIDALNKEDFKTRQSRRYIYWLNEFIFENFIVAVSNNCQSKSCIATIKICINKKPVGDIVIKSKVTDMRFSEEVADIDLKPYNHKKEIADTRRILLTSLENERELLKEKISSTFSQEGKNELNRDLAICENSIKILTDSPAYNNPILKVFISSTSDLSQYRKAIKTQVESCSMYPEMYENWPQKDRYPRDYCCEKVLSSDIFVCILGPKYGFIEPMMEASMTEIEYRVALQAGKPILIYIIDEYERLMSELTAEYAANIEKQRKLIKELEIKRIVEYFKDETSLALLSSRELILIQKQIDYDQAKRKQN